MKCNNQQPDDDDKPRLTLCVPPDPETREITWVNTVEMVGTIRLTDSSATWEEVQREIDAGNIGDDGDEFIIFDDTGIIARVVPTEIIQEYNDGFAIEGEGEGGNDHV